VFLGQPIALKPVSDRTIDQIAIDFTSEGQIDLTTTDPQAALRQNYPNVGLSQATATVTLRDPTNATSTLTVTRHVIAESLPITRLTLCKVFNDIKSRLASNSTGANSRR
jgi:hypothetical protein